MAKTPKTKKREISANSRAARRGASPVVLPKGSASKGAGEESDYKPWLHTPTGAGITKKKKTKTLTRQQRVRQQKGSEKADAITNKLEKKVADSTNRGRKVDARRADWEELNDKIAGKKKSKKEKALEKAVEEAGAKPMEDVVVADVMATVPDKVTEAGVVEGADQGDWEDVDEVL
ncbi:uncharacterized protein RCC_09182 [Ramularia collo-cygni]|uniref:Alb1-domain-containing protein n=1 Tax=Ramularia collo-cygni TaxID=112498 RepID=A0A2D3VNT4_9PEZI|nr:uncharacterized protein RCC_09182 [Ramularia collo-cygni]CZT23468.1 uncharacterized protein RCC_09182 [Ramularia collo-cygni]